MPIFTEKNRTGISSVDAVIMPLISFVNKNINNASNDVLNSQNTNYIITNMGATAYKFSNASGGTLVNGANVEYFNGGVTLSPAGSRKNFGVVYGTWPPYGPCYVVVNGPCMVYFNPSGATAGHWWRMARENDTIYHDTGMAQSLPFSSVDPLQYMGIVLESRIGEGVAKCVKVR